MRETGRAGYKAAMKRRLFARFTSLGYTVRFQHNDPNENGQQGIPDLTVFIGPYWFLLEAKASEKSKLRPNQEWWINKWSEVTFCSFIYPENEEEVFRAMERSLAA